MQLLAGAPPACLPACLLAPFRPRHLWWGSGLRQAGFPCPQACPRSPPRAPPPPVRVPRQAPSAASAPPWCCRSWTPSCRGARQRAARRWRAAWWFAAATAPASRPTTSSACRWAGVAAWAVGSACCARPSLPPLSPNKQCTTRPPPCPRCPSSAPSAPTPGLRLLSGGPPPDPRPGAAPGPRLLCGAPARAAVLLPGRHPGGGGPPAARHRQGAAVAPAAAGSKAGQGRARCVHCCAGRRMRLLRWSPHPFPPCPAPPPPAAGRDARPARLPGPGPVQQGGAPPARPAACRQGGRVGAHAAAPRHGRRSKGGCGAGAA